MPLVVMWQFIHHPLADIDRLTRPHRRLHVATIALGGEKEPTPGPQRGQQFAQCIQRPIDMFERFAKADEIDAAGWNDLAQVVGVDIEGVGFESCRAHVSDISFRQL